MIEINRNTRTQYNVGKIKYGKTQTKIPLGRLRSGNIDIIGTRKRDGMVSRSSVEIKVQKPKWKHSKFHKKTSISCKIKGVPHLL